MRGRGDFSDRASEKSTSDHFGPTTHKPLFMVMLYLSKSFCRRQSSGETFIPHRARGLPEPETDGETGIFLFARRGRSGVEIEGRLYAASVGEGRVEDRAFSDFEMNY